MFKLLMDDGTEYELTAETTVIGRTQGDIQLTEDQRASRRHSELLVRDDRLHVRDLGSTNGTFVNGRRIAEEEQVGIGDIIQVGATRFTVVMDVPEDATVAMSHGVASEPPPDATRVAPVVEPPAPEPEAPAQAPEAPAAPPPPTPPPAPPGAPAGPPPSPAGPPPAPAAPEPPGAQAPAPPPAPVERKASETHPPATSSARRTAQSKSRTLCLILEVVPALFGLLGIGWIYAGRLKVGLSLLGGGVLFGVVVTILSIFTAGCVLFIALVLWPAAIVASAVMLHRFMASEPGLFT